jgi:hypothetical protein
VTFTAAGTYFFYNASLQINGGASVTMSSTTAGVNIVLLGNSNVTINGGTVILNALASNPTYPALNGVLFDDQATGAFKVNGGGTYQLGGAVYVPNADVTWSGTSQPTNTTCSAVIGKTIDMTGTAYLNTVGCLPTTVAYTQVVALVQ